MNISIKSPHSLPQSARHTLDLDEETLSLLVELARMREEEDRRCPIDRLRLDTFYRQVTAALARAPRFGSVSPHRVEYVCDTCLEVAAG